MKVMASGRALVRLGGMPSMLVRNFAAVSGSQTAGPKHSPPSTPNEKKDEKAGMVYKNPEYFQYDKYSFADLDVALTKYRLPQPSSERK